MAFYKFSAIIGILLVTVTIVIQSAPIEQPKPSKKIIEERVQNLINFSIY
jgi:hypothetical protein